MLPGYHARVPGCDRDADRARTHAAKPSHSNYNRGPMPVAIPARVHNVDAARSQFGARVDRLIAALARQDPLADAAAAALSELPAGGHALVDAALRGTTTDAPPPLRELLARCVEPIASPIASPILSPIASPEPEPEPEIEVDVEIDPAANDA